MEFFNSNTHSEARKKKMHPLTPESRTQKILAVFMTNNTSPKREPIAPYKKNALGISAIKIHDPPAVSFILLYKWDGRDCT
jgi:hypothetical protein